MKRVAIFVILAALTVGFSSCSAVRHCQAPEVEMPGQIASGYTDSLTIADLSWWQFYGDSTLRRVIELTLENNKDMLAAAARVEQMRQLYRISKAERLPNFRPKGWLITKRTIMPTRSRAVIRSSVPSSPSVGSWTFGETCAGPSARAGRSISLRSRIGVRCV